MKSINQKLNRLQKFAYKSKKRLLSLPIQKKNCIGLLVYCISFCISFISLFILLTINSAAQQSGGGYAGSWTSREFSARPLAMGGVFTGLADDPNAIYYNPAGLSDLPEYPTLLSSVSMLGLGRTNSTLAWGQQIAPNIGFGIAFNNFYTGSFIARDVRGHAFSEYSNFQYMLALSASYKIAYASFGTTIKYLTDNLQGSETFANGYSIDFGAMFDVMGYFKFGAQLQNASSFLFWNTVHSDIMNLPWKIKTGVSTSFPTTVAYYEDRSTSTGEMMIEDTDFGNFLTIGLDISYAQYSIAPVISLAAEYEAHKYITFRGGMALYGDNWGQPQLFPMNNWGIGLTIYPDIDYLNDNLPFTFSIDYTISKELLNVNGINHSISLNFNF